MFHLSIIISDTIHIIYLITRPFTIPKESAKGLLISIFISHKAAILKEQSSLTQNACHLSTHMRHERAQAWQ